MTTPQDTGNQVQADIASYRDKIVALGQSTPYSEGYVDALGMAIFLVQAAVHRQTLQGQVDHLRAELADALKDTPARSFRIDFDDVNRTAQVVAE